MQVVLDETYLDTSFIDLDSIDDRPLRLVRDANWITGKEGRAFHQAPRNFYWTPVSVSKVLHRLRPRLVPIYDSVLLGFYGVNDPPAFYRALHTDMNVNRELLTTLTRGRRTSDNRSLSALRATDIVVWHHVRTRCRKRSR